MNSLLEKEGMDGKVQMVYFDPPYGIKYGSNFQPFTNKKDVKEKDEDLTSEPEMLKAFRDTWELGLHSYLTYLRDRLLLAKDLLHESGSVFVQISDENVHLIRSVLDEVFEMKNFVAEIKFKTTGGRSSDTLDRITNYILWYSKDKSKIKYFQLFNHKDENEIDSYDWVETENGQLIALTNKHFEGKEPIPIGRRYQLTDLTSQGETDSGGFTFTFNGIAYKARKGRHWTTNEDGLKELVKSKRIQQKGDNVFF